MIGDTDYSHPLIFEHFTQKLNQDEAQLSQIQNKVDQLSQHIKIEPSSQQLILLNESIKLLKSSMETFNNDFQLLRQMLKIGELANKLELTFRKDLDLLIDDKRGRLNKAKATLDIVNNLFPQMDDLAEGMDSNMNTQEIQLLLSIGKKELLKEADLSDMQKILKENPNILFEKLENEISVFRMLMQSPHAHDLFDQIMLYAGEQLYQTKSKGMQEIIRFAFSRTRYEKCYAQDSHITSAISLKGEGVLKKCSIKDLNEALEKFKSQRPQKFEDWLLQRMGTSNSLTHPYTNRELLRNNWIKAQGYALNKAFQHAGTPTKITREFMEGIHKLMAAGDQEIPHPGVTRDVVNSPAAAGSSWMNNMCAPPLLSDRLDELIDWMNDEFGKCNEGQKNPLLFAAQTYQRVVSLHPFENGNGRMARLMMDYVLARYDIPPVVMGKNEKDVNIAVFPLLPESTRNPTEFYNNMLNRISESFYELNKELKTLI